MVAAGHAHAVERHSGRVTGTNTHKADNRVVVAEHAKIVVRNADSLTGRGLAGDGDERIADPQLAVQMDAPRHIKDNSAWAISFERLAQTARAAVVEVCDMPHLAATSAEREPAVTLSAGERQMARAECPNV